MSEQEGRRTVTGLAKRQPGQPAPVADLSRLMRSTREEPEKPVAVTEAEDKEQKSTIYLPARLRHRARAAFNATRSAEKDRSWSNMVAKALLAEVERRERAHNNGQPFVGGEDPLPAGRPLDN